MSLLKPYNPLAIPNAFIRGEIDAASLWQPNTYNTIIAMKELGRPYTHFKNTGFHTSEVILGTHKSTLVKNSDQIKRLLKTLKEAEDFLVNNPETAHKIIAEKMKISGPEIQNIFEQIQPRLAPISPSYLENIEMLSLWIRENDTEFTDKNAPNYLDYIDNSYYLDAFTKNGSLLAIE